MHFSIPPFLLLLLTLTGGHRSVRQQNVLGDSAGVAVVEHRVASRGITAFRVAPVPLLDVGGIGRGALHNLDGVTGAYHLSAGRVVVANSRPPELRVFSQNGLSLAQIGERGQGAGEFASEGFSVVRRAGDSLLSYDPLLRLLYLFTVNGTFVRSWSTAEWKLPGDTLAPVISHLHAGAFSDGSALFARSHADGQLGFTRDSISLYRMSRSGEVMAQFGDFVGGGLRRLTPFNTTGIRNTGTSGTYAVVSTEDVVRPVFLRVDGDRLLYLDDRANELRIYSSSGVLSRVVKLHGEAVYRRADVNRNPGEAPVRLGFLVDDAGRIWIEDYRTPSDQESRWTVLDPGGQLIGSVLMPRRVRILSIGTDRFLGVRRDRNEFEHVVAFKLSPVRSRT